MPSQLRKYLEKLEFRVLRGGQRVLMPDERDYAIRNLELDRRRIMLEHMDEETTPPEIEEAAATAARQAEEAARGTSFIATLNLTGVTEEVLAAIQQVQASLDAPSNRRYEEAAAMVREWKYGRMGRRSRLEADIAELARLLTQMERLMDQPETVPGRSEVKYYALSEIAHGQRMKIEEKYAPIDPETQQRMLDKPRRDLAMLTHALAGLYKPDIPDGTDPDEIAWEAGDVEPFGKVEEELGDREATTLINRMWARAEMDPSLVPYFRPGRDADRDGE